MLRQHCDKHWHSDSEHFEEPELNEQEKGHIRNLVPQVLADQNSKLRTAAPWCALLLSCVSSNFRCLICAFGWFFRRDHAGHCCDWTVSTSQATGR